MKKEYATYYDYIIAVYKVRIFWYSFFGTVGLLITHIVLSFNVNVSLMIQVPLLIVLIWALTSFVRFVQLDFQSFCLLLGSEFIYDKINADYQKPIKTLKEGFVGKTYFIKKNPQIKTRYEAADFYIKHDDVSWAYYQTIQHHVFGIRVKKTKALQVFAYPGNTTLVLRKKDNFDLADFLEEQGVAFIVGYSQERQRYYEALESKPLFIHTVVHAEQATIQADSAGPIYNKPQQEVVLVKYKTLGEQLQAARAQLFRQLLGGRRKIGMHLQVESSATGRQDTEQLALDLDTAAYKIVDEGQSPIVSKEGALHANLEDPKLKKQKETTNGGNI